MLFPCRSPKYWNPLESGHFWASISDVSYISVWKQPILISIHDIDDGLWQQTTTNIGKAQEIFSKLEFLNPLDPPDFEVLDFEVLGFEIA